MHHPSVIFVSFFRPGRQIDPNTWNAGSFTKMEPNGFSLFMASAAAVLIPFVLNKRDNIHTWYCIFGQIPNVAIIRKDPIKFLINTFIWQTIKQLQQCLSALYTWNQIVHLSI